MLRTIACILVLLVGTIGLSQSNSDEVMSKREVAKIAELLSFISSEEYVVIGDFMYDKDRDHVPLPPGAKVLASFPQFGIMGPGRILVELPNPKQDDSAYAEFLELLEERGWKRFNLDNEPLNFILCLFNIDENGGQDGMTVQVLYDGYERDFSEAYWSADDPDRGEFKTYAWLMTGNGTAMTCSQFKTTSDPE
jgi:hypothetical protein